MSVTGPTTEPQTEPQIDWLAALRSLSQSNQQSSERTPEPRPFQPPVAEFHPPSEETATPLGQGEDIPGQEPPGQEPGQEPPGQEPGQEPPGQEPGQEKTTPPLGQDSGSSRSSRSSRSSLTETKQAEERTLESQQDTTSSTAVFPDLPAEAPASLPQPPVPGEDTTSTPVPCESTPRSSDSDGAFETPESTTPVKSPTETGPHTQLQTSEDTGLGCDSEADGEPGSEAKGHHGSSLSIVFDEDKPIAASGAYNLDQLIAAAVAAEAQSRSLLTRSLSLQAGELDGSDPLDGEGSSISIGDSRPLAEAFSVDSSTESAPGTLRRPSKKGPLLPGGSLKKKPLSRQSSNVESPQPPSSGTTPELKKSANPSRAVSPLLGSEDPQVGGTTVDSAPGPTSATPSPEGTLCRTRKPCVESPTPLIEETNHTSPETDSQLILAPTSILTTTQAISIPFQQEDTPISVPEAPLGSEGSPPSGAYKWDPDNFENIDPFNTGGSKVANSPPLGRKGVANSPPLGRKGVVLSIAPKTVAPVSNPNPPERPPTISNDEPALPSTSPPIRTSGAVRLEFDYSEETLEEPPKASPPPKKLGRKPGSKMPLRKPRKDNTSVTVPDDVPVPKASYIFDPTQWDDPNINPFGSNAGIPISPKLNKPSYSFDPDASHASAVNPFKGSSNRMAEFPPKAASGSASFEVSANDNEVDNDNDEVRELEDHNRNRPAKTKKKPIKSNTFRVKRSPKRSPTSDPSSQGPTPKLVSSANHKWASMEAELTSDPQEDFPQPSDLTAFVNENSRVSDYEIEYMEKIGSSLPPLSVKKPSALYLKLDSVTGSLTKPNHGSEPNSPCTGSFEEIEAQITAQMKTPVLGSRPGPEGSRPGPEGSAGEKEKTRKRESQSLSRTQSTDRDHAAKRDREVMSSTLDRDSTVTKSSLYTRTVDHGEGERESPYLPKDLDRSLGIAREEIVSKEQELLQWQRKYEDSRQEVLEMR
ncbi:hypothetical protein J4Q44_G00274550 [Coregonus suidteri]|uniref:Transforming acidic coiled-coil-containing protein 2 n=1 Tax=Coregonus suidteri TaxID=861788 RepID=A0AAN8QTL9_9TELE